MQYFSYLATFSFPRLMQYFSDLIQLASWENTQKFKIDLNLGICNSKGFQMNLKSLVLVSVWISVQNFKPCNLLNGNV